ncbi:YhbY family RNA-binding protein [bacterium]|nr:YhbY family RNA-binding protein [bacterium]
MDLSKRQKEQLKRRAHHLKPVVYIGHQGLGEAQVQKTEEGLMSHELIKVKFTDHKDEVRDLAVKLAEQTDGSLIGIIGYVAIIYRPHPDPELRRVKITV